MKSGVLNETCSLGFSRDCHGQHQFRTRFRVPYIQRITLASPRQSAPDWVRAIHKVADRVEVVTKDSLLPKSRLDCIKELCYLFSDNDSNCLPKLRNNCLASARRLYRISDDDIERDVFAAAIYLDLLSMVQDMVHAIISQASRGEVIVSPLFGNPIHVAAKHNRMKALQLLLDEVFASDKLRLSRFPEMRHEALIRAAGVGHLEIVDLLLSDRWGPIVVNERKYDRNFKSRTRTVHLLDSGLDTPDPAIFKKAFDARQSTCLKGAIPAPMLSRIALRHVVEDNKDMLHWLLRTHFCEARDDFFPQAIKSACCRGYYEMVQLLFEYAPPQEKTKNGLVCRAAAAGRIGLVQLLLDEGNNINDEVNTWQEGNIPPAIVSAVALEHTQMFYFLRERGATFESAQKVEKAGGIAKGMGLDSMLQLLAEEGVGIERLSPYSDCHLCAGCRKILNSKKMQSEPKG